MFFRTILSSFANSTHFTKGIYYFTVTLKVLLTPFALTVIFTFLAFFPFTTPFAVTVATRRQHVLQFCKAASTTIAAACLGLVLLVLVNSSANIANAMER